MSETKIDISRLAYNLDRKEREHTLSELLNNLPDQVANVLEKLEPYEAKLLTEDLVAMFSRVYDNGHENGMEFSSRIASEDALWELLNDTEDKEGENDG